MKTNKYDGNGNVIKPPMSLDEFFRIKVMGFSKEVFWSLISGVGVFVFLAILCSIGGYIFELNGQLKHAEVVVDQLKIPALWFLCIAIGWCIRLKILTNKGEL